MRIGSIKSLAIALAVVGSGSASHAAVTSYQAFLSGPSESPPNASPGVGFGTFTYDSTAHTLAINMSFSGLLGTTTNAHIHAATTVPGTGTAGVATTTPTFAGFPLGVTSGSYAATLDLTLASSYNPAYVTANGGSTAASETALVTAMNAGESYVNIHTTVVPGGEIRGFLSSVPEPTSVTAVGVAVLLLRRRR